MRRSSRRCSDPGPPLTVGEPAGHRRGRPATVPGTWTTPARRRPAATISNSLRVPRRPRNPRPDAARELQTSKNILLKGRPPGGRGLGRRTSVDHLARRPGRPRRSRCVDGADGRTSGGSATPLRTFPSAPRVTNAGVFSYADSGAQGSRQRPPASETVQRPPSVLGAHVVLDALGVVEPCIAPPSAGGTATVGAGVRQTRRGAPLLGEDRAVRTLCRPSLQAGDGRTAVTCVTPRALGKVHDAGLTGDIPIQVGDRLDVILADLLVAWARLASLVGRGWCSPAGSDRGSTLPRPAGLRPEFDAQRRGRRRPGGTEGWFFRTGHGEGCSRTWSFAHRTERGDSRTGAVLYRAHRQPGAFASEWQPMIHFGMPRRTAHTGSSRANPPAPSPPTPLPLALTLA